MASILAVVPKPKIFREYISSNSATDDTYGGFPVDIINTDIPEFHFILAFAKENYDPDTKKGTGNFRATWSVKNFGVDSIKKLKKDYPNVKVIISIGGRSTDTPAFNPEEKYNWVENAKKTLRDIILTDYKNDDHCHCGSSTVIDGIDIAYEGVESDDFSYCIGKVIDFLKKKIDGLVVSIAPSQPVLSQYTDLYNKAKKDDIDIKWVNYQYYDQKVSRKDDLVNRHNGLIVTFTVEKLLAGFSTDPNDGDNITQTVFLDGCEELVGSGSLVGIFVFDSNYSKDFENPFSVEKKSQELLTDGSD